ncbi:MAG: ABC transporter ATP-binding protein [Phycisphaerae bacterium]
MIQLRGLTKLYRMGDSIVRALDGVDLSVDSGEFVAITGPSGSGKSTMMHVLGCLDRPTAGEYVLNGQRVSDLSDRELAIIRNRYIGFVFQTFNLINRTTALENVSVPLFYARQANTRAAALEALERVGLRHRAGHRPSELSGGERQRVAIARAIVNSPVFLLADEPTGNLDSRTGEQIMQVFHALNAQGVTIVLVTHEPDIALQARRIVQMRDGKIVADRPAEEFVRSGEIPRPATASHVLLAPDSPLAAAMPNGDRSPTYDALPPRMMPGANTALGCGVFAIVAVLASMCIGMLVPRPTPDQLAVAAKPPTSLSVMVLATAIAMLLGIISGVVAIFWAKGVMRRIRTEPGNWLGRGRARAGGLLGWLVVGFPVLSVAYGIVSRMLAARG